MEICGFLCGIIRDKEDSMMADIRLINDAMLGSLHEDRMMRMLVCDALMYSRAWHDTTLARGKVVAQVQEDVESYLLTEMAAELCNFNVLHKCN